MDFLPVAPGDSPKRTYQCLAVITVGGSAAARRGSTDSNSDKESGNALSRIMSGGQRRKSVQAGVNGKAAEHPHVPGSDGTWYWRCRENLVVLPISSPPNPLLRSSPPPLSAALHNGEATNNVKAGATSATNGHHDEGIGSKFMGGLRRASAAFIHPKEASAASAAGGASAAGTDPSTDGTAAPQLPPIANDTNGASSSAPVSEQAATNDTASVPAETGWPGVVEGQPLHAILVPLHYLHKEKIHMGGRDRIDNMHVSVPIGSAIAGKSGLLRFEFDKDWVGGKAEAELLKHSIETAVAASSPLFQNVKLGGEEKRDKQYEPGWQDKVRGKW